MSEIPQLETVFCLYPPQDENEWDCQCARCGSSADYQPCEECGGEGVDGHDCGEDVCCCLYPEENVTCQFCNGHGGRYWCLSSPEFCRDNPCDDREKVERGTIEWFVAPQR